MNIKNCSYWLLLLTYIGVGMSLYGEEKILYGMIINRTKEKPVKADVLELVELTEKGMKTIQEYKNYGPRFNFLITKKNPILIRAKYKGQNYISLVSMVDLTKGKTIQKKIYVYETTKKLKGMVIHSGFQVTRYQNHLEINMIYAIQNKTKPPVTVLPDNMLFSIPKNAKIIRATLNQEISQIPLQVQLESIKKESETYYRINRAIKPGNSELVIKIEIPEHTFQSKIDPVFHFTRTNRKKFFRVLMWRPIDAIPSIKGGKIEEKNVPNLGKAYLIYYENNQVEFQFRKGSFLFKNPMKAFINPIFDRPYKTTFAIVLGNLLIFLLISFLTGNLWDRGHVKNS